MATTQAKASYGTLFRWNGHPLAEVTNIAGPNLSIDTIDASHYNSPQHFKEFIAGFGDGGEVTLECTFVPGDTVGQVAFTTDAYAKTTREAVIELGVGPVATWTFDAMVTGLNYTQPMADKLGFTATLKVSGVPVLAINESLGLTTLAGVEQETAAALTFVPTFANAKYDYTIQVNTASTWVKLTATELTNPHTIHYSVDGGSWNELDSGVESGNITIGEAGTTTLIAVRAFEESKIAKTYRLYIGRP